RGRGSSLPSLPREARGPVILSAAGAKDLLLTAAGTHDQPPYARRRPREPRAPPWVTDRLLVRHRRDLRRPDPDQTDRALGGVGERVRHERVYALAAPVLLEPRLEYCPSARRNRVGLHARQRMSRVTVRVDLVEHGAHDVEVAREARPRAHHEQPHSVADVDLERMLLVLECAPVEHDIARFPLERLLPIGLAGQGAVAALHVELALHDDEFLVNLARPPALWVHDNREIHPLH